MVQKTVNVMTTISVSEDLADHLYALKRRGDTYEDVIWRLMEEADLEIPDDRLQERPDDEEI